MSTNDRKASWRWVRGLVPPTLLLLIVAVGLGYALFSQWNQAERNDQENMREWVEEARSTDSPSLPDQVREYARLAVQVQTAGSNSPEAKALRLKRDELYEQLKVMGNPPKMYPGQIPLFPVIYRLEVRFPPSTGSAAGDQIAWDSDLPRPRGAGNTREQDIAGVRQLPVPVADRHDRNKVLATIVVDYQLHAVSKQQRDELERQSFYLALSGLGVLGIILATVYVYLFFRREREREMHQLLARQQLEHERAERYMLENDLRKQEIERREVERRLLEQEITTQKVEQRALELKSQLFASIGIMAGSYAHNIKNLLVRPNDLLRRCLEVDGLRQDQRQMMEEIGGTLHTVTERLQLILKTVRRDPTQSEMAQLNLQEIVQETESYWQVMAEQKWKLNLVVDCGSEPLWIDGDRSHLIQLVENLLFNARDATFEMRNSRRDQVRSNGGLNDEERRKALIAAISWKGMVTMRARREGSWAVLEVEDNGIGMNEEVRRRCVETHFSTKRDNALHQGNSTGMGLGLSFVQAILEQHGGQMEISSQPLKGALFRVRFALKEKRPETVEATNPQRAAAPRQES